MQRISSNVTNNARTLRKRMTDVEQLLWHKIRSRQLRNYRFRRQHPIGRYIVDFICLETKLIIELDGGQHADQKKYDNIRDIFLTQQGFNVLRFWNNEVLNNLDGVLLNINQHLPPPSLPPKKDQGGGTKSVLPPVFLEIRLGGGKSTWF